MTAPVYFLGCAVHGCGEPVTKGSDFCPKHTRRPAGRSPRVFCLRSSTVERPVEAREVVVRSHPLAPLQGGEVATRRAVNSDIAGSTPAPAANFRRARKTAIRWAHNPENAVRLRGHATIFASVPKRQRGEAVDLMRSGASAHQLRGGGVMPASDEMFPAGMVISVQLRDDVEPEHSCSPACFKCAMWQASLERTALERRAREFEAMRERSQLYCGWDANGAPCV